jgi:hypothetical protein
MSLQVDGRSSLDASANGNHADDDSELCITSGPFRAVTAM